MSNVVFLDTETTGLDPDRHEIWEVALIEKTVYSDGSGHWKDHVWQLPVDLGKADPMALNIGRFHERRATWHTEPSLYLQDDFAPSFEKLTRGKHLCGAVVSFDEERLRKLLRATGVCPMWHYHLIDVEALAVGRLAGMNYFAPFPWNSDDLSKTLGVEISEKERHTALGDARWAKDLYEKVMGPV